MDKIRLEDFMAQLRATREKVQTKFVRRLLDYAIIRTERMITQDGRRPIGSLPRIPASNAQIVDAAIAGRDIEKILSIRDTRGSHGADEDRLVELIEKFCEDSEDGSNVSTRQIKQEAERRGLRADRGRIEKLREQLNLGKDEAAARAKRVSSLHYIDLAFVHLQEQVTVLGFAAKGCDDWVQRIGKLEKEEAPAPLIAPTSADRARLTDFTRQLIETKAALEGGHSTNWQLLLKDLESADEKIVLFHVFSGADLPTEVSKRLRQLATVMDFDRDWLLKELMRPEMFYLGAGYLPTMADTLQRLALAGGGTSGTICIHQSEAARMGALWLRHRLQIVLSEQGIRVHRGTRKAFRLAKRAKLNPEGSSEYSGTALLVPSPLELPIFRLDEPSDFETIKLDFTGADDVLARSRVDDLVGLFNRVLRLQQAFAEGHKTEPMLKCAEFFCAPNVGLSAIRDVMGRRPDFRKMTKDVRAIWAAYVLTLFDPDLLQLDFESNDPMEGFFTKAFEQFRVGGAEWIEAWRVRALRANARTDGVRPVVEEAVEATVVVMVQRLSRVWKFGVDEAAQRMATAIERVSREKYHGTEWRKNPQESIPRLAAYFEGVWPTVWISKRTVEAYAFKVFRYARADFRKQSGKSDRIAFDDEENAGGIPERMLVTDSDNSPIEEPADTPETLIRNRLNTPIAEGEDRRLAAWYAQLFGATRRFIEKDAKAELLPPDVLPPQLASLLREAVQRLRAGSKCTKAGNDLREALEKFFDDQR